MCSGGLAPGTRPVPSAYAARARGLLTVTLIINNREWHSKPLLPASTQDATPAPAGHCRLYPIYSPPLPHPVRAQTVTLVGR